MWKASCALKFSSVICTCMIHLGRPKHSYQIWRMEFMQGRNHSRIILMFPACSNHALGGILRHVDSWCMNRMCMNDVVNRREIMPRILHPAALVIIVHSIKQNACVTHSICTPHTTILVSKFLTRVLCTTYIRAGTGPGWESHHVTNLLALKNFDMSNI